ncbi:hypothetical protein STEG23_008161, partial [Scotinomys teguina]
GVKLSMDNFSSFCPTQKGRGTSVRVGKVEMVKWEEEGRSESFRPGCPGTHAVDQAVLELTEI